MLRRTECIELFTCCCCSAAQLCLTLWDPMGRSTQVSLSFTISWSFLQFMSIESVMPSKHLILCCPLLLLPSIFPSIRVFSNELALQFRWPKYWSLISRVDFFRIDWFDLLAVQGILESLLQHHSSKASTYMLGNLYFSVFQNVSYGTLILQNTSRKKYT